MMDDCRDNWNDYVSCFLEFNPADGFFSSRLIRPGLAYRRIGPIPET